MKILISGNPAFGLAEALNSVLVEHELTFVSRTTHKLDLTKTENQQVFADMSIDYDVVILNSALWKFNQTLLLEAVYKKLKIEG